MVETEFETLEFDHVYFSYQQEETIRDLCFTIKKGEMIALVGHNGAGKSTIIKLILRLYDPTEGTIRLNGIDTMMTKEFDEEGAVLSGGESQKVAVARAFYRKCPIKIFDEPSSALDPIAEHMLFKSIMEDGKRNTIILISHRLSSVKNTDYVLVLEQGRIIERGSHRELIELHGSYAKMYQKQAMNYLTVDSVEDIVL